MPCYYPITAWRSRTPNASGKYGLVFKKEESRALSQIQIPCGSCIGCKLERSRQWAIRCVHEASLYPHNCFITLTYDDDHLPSNGSLRKVDFQKFMRRLRKAVRRIDKKLKIRFFHCGEYGDRFGRPHYHALIFGFDFLDKYLWRTTSAGCKAYRSPLLEKLWPYGNSELGDVTFESAAYVARYCVKKVTGVHAAAHYTRVDADTGEFFRISPEYTTMSRRPGIGRPWLEKYAKEVFDNDSVVMRGIEMKPPKAYDKYFEELIPEAFEDKKRARRKKALKRKLDNTIKRLQVREKVARARVKQLKREVE